MIPSNGWDESKPAGSELLNTADDTIRQLKLDLRERLATSLLWNTGNEGANTDSGAVASAGPATITDNAKAWGDDQWKGAYVLITDGLGVGQYREVASNTSNSLTVIGAWSTQPDATSVYRVEMYDVGTLRLGSARLLIGPDIDKPTAGIQVGTAFFSTDITALSVWNGTGWLTIFSKADFDKTLDSQPADLTVLGDGGVNDQPFYSYTVLGGVLGAVGSLHLRFQLAEVGATGQTWKINYGASQLTLAPPAPGTSNSTLDIYIYAKPSSPEGKVQYIFAIYQNDAANTISTVAVPVPAVRGVATWTEDSTIDKVLSITLKRSGSAANFTTRKAAVLTRT